MKFDILESSMLSLLISDMKTGTDLILQLAYSSLMEEAFQGSSTSAMEFYGINLIYFSTHQNVVISLASASEYSMK
ncbi:hypothetical protein SK128_003959 [Halocaridina rubra]|uniref:Uncharacterized protein n=1 Tax=Halocaridina rubra TaxID=373956 RepID=A0AAN9A3P7_HALRR